MKKHLHAMISCICLCHTICCYAFSPRQGDLFFQDLNCGSLCNAITNVTQGYGHTQVSHVGMFVKFHGHADIIEAIGTKVQLTPLKTFLQRSIDTQGKPRVMVGRLKMQYQKLIPNAVDAPLSWQGLPYNASFTPDNHMRKFYCSQLVADAFQSSNHSVTFFKINRMNFEKNGHILPAWKMYFKEIHQMAPQGQPGTNPGMMSRSDKLTIIYHYGQLRPIKKARQ